VLAWHPRALPRPLQSIASFAGCCAAFVPQPVRSRARGDILIDAANRLAVLEDRPVLAVGIDRGMTAGRAHGERHLMGVVVRLVRCYGHLPARQMLHHHLAMWRLPLEILRRRDGDVLAVAVRARLPVDRNLELRFTAGASAGESLDSERNQGVTARPAACRTETSEGLRPRSHQGPTTGRRGS